MLNQTGSFGAGDMKLTIPVTARFWTTVAGKTATGLLLMGAHKARIRPATITDIQTGVFDVGDGTRVLDTQLGDIASDGIVFLGHKNRALGNLIDVSSVSGLFIDGDRNAIRGGHMSDMPIGVWFFAGNHDMPVHTGGGWDGLQLGDGSMHRRGVLVRV